MAEHAALSFGGLLRQLRAEARLTQEELAEAAGLSPRSVSDLERGINRTAHKDTAGLLADALGLTGPVRALFVAAARGRGPAGDVLAAREGGTPDAAHALAGTPRPYGEQVLAVRNAVEGERKQVTVLLCDLVGSGDLAELEPEEDPAVADRFIRFALDEVRRYEGTIYQVRRNGFTALFGAPIGQEDHARRAVLAALGIAAGAEARVRTGINSGLVVVGAISDDLLVDCTPVGDTITRAARLQAAAPPGVVLVSQRTAGLVRGYFRVEEVAPVKIGGPSAAAAKLREHAGYSWIYGQILASPGWFSSFLHRHGLHVPAQAPGSPPLLQRNAVGKVPLLNGGQGPRSAIPGGESRASRAVPRRYTATTDKHQQRSGQSTVNSGKQRAQVSRTKPKTTPRCHRCT